MTSAHSMHIDDLTKRRKDAVRKAHFCSPLFALTCPETRVGVVVAEQNYGKKTMTAYYFRPAQINRSFASETVESAHDHFSALQKAKDKIAGEKAEKVAGHDFKVGDIIASVWGVTSRDVNFYKVVDASKKREVTVVELATYFHSGDWMAGSKLPIETQEIGSPRTFKTIVKNGTSYLKSNSITSAAKWQGKPISVHCD